MMFSLYCGNACTSVEEFWCGHYSPTQVLADKQVRLVLFDAGSV